MRNDIVDNMMPVDAESRSLDVVRQHDRDLGRADLDLALMLGSVWSRKWWIVSLTLIFVLTALAYVFVATPWYRAEAVLMPRNASSGGAFAAELSRFSGLADLAGLNLRQGLEQEPLGVLKSKGFARRFIEQNKLAPTLANHNRSAAAGESNGAEPDIRKVVDSFLRENLTVVEDKKAGLVRVAVLWRDPVLAARWANGITSQINEEMRQRTLADATRNIEYLRGQLSSTDAVSLQQAAARLMEGEMQKVMLAQGNDEFAFRVIDEAQPPAKREKPRRAVIVALAFLAGLAFSILVAVVIDPLRDLVEKAGRPAPGNN